MERIKFTARSENNRYFHRGYLIPHFYFEIKIDLRKKLDEHPNKKIKQSRFGLKIMIG